jgi:hypothetical protein
MGSESQIEHEDGLHPGDTFDCQLCSQKSLATLNNGMLECSNCLYQIQEYDTVMHDRITLDDEGGMSGRGPGSRRKRIHGSVIGGRGSSSLSRRWKRLEFIDRAGRSGPTRSKTQSIKLIRKLAATHIHRQISLDLLEVGWPDAHSSEPDSAAKDTPMWRPAHPHGVPASAAVCLHLSAMEMGFDSKFEEWVTKCMPGVSKAKSYGYRCLKRMRAILGEARLRRESMDKEASAILSRANLGETIYSGIAGMIWDEWLEISASGNNAMNHPRPVLAALCEIAAERGGMPIEAPLIEKRFNISRSYKAWLDKL